MKRILAFILIFVLSLSLTTRAEEQKQARVVLGADLTESQRDEVYALLGVTRGSVTELTMTNAAERSYLEGSVPDEQLGTRSISSVFLEETDGENSVKTANINWCTESMYLSAMATAGIGHVSIRVAAPFEVSGTAALAGIYMAYEDMTGVQLGEAEKQAGIQDLLIAGQLSEELGGDEAMTLVTELKLMLTDTLNMSDAELTDKIDELAGEYKITLNDYQREKLLELCRSLEKLDPDTLREKVEGVKNTLEKMGEWKDKAVSFWDALIAFFRAIGEFIAKITEIFK